MSGQFDHLLNWRLLKGGHDFPGPDGGTCINEAAVVAAGMSYRRIMGAGDLPDCFSVPLSMFALGLNDSMGDHERERLMPFVMRLSGTRDLRNVEKTRSELIIVRTANAILPSLLRSLGYQPLADGLEKAESRAAILALAEMRKVTSITKIVIAGLDRSAVKDRHCIAAVSSFSVAVRQSDVENAMLSCANAVGHVALADFKNAPKVWDAAIEILDAACKIGRQPDPIAVPLIEERFEAARREAVPELV